ncbi:DUF1616 domain-containing protein [Halorussus halobius]|uniref:DUF1616 domain-containing protein n=1 Tax=Halorussus halobius TaxID=1710537 RepID=UPI0010919834|nr:DUF1616 domain-containing protein [Halorussus halobius]
MARTNRWLLVPRPVRRFPPDLAVVVGLVVATALAVVLPGVRDSMVRVALGAVFVLVAPGYALTAALFPEAKRSRASDSGPGEAGPEGESNSEGGARRESGATAPASSDSSSPDASGLGFRSLGGRGTVTLPERALFSVALSVVVVPLVALVVNFTPWDVGLASLAVSLGALTLAAVAVAAVRRRRVPADERFRVPAREWADAARSELLDPASRADAVLDGVLVAAVVVAVAGGAYAVAGPQQGQSFTEFYVLGENETGDLVADDYPETLGPGENATVVVGIDNHEGQSTAYEVVVRLQRVTVEGGNATVAESRRVDRFRETVGANETVERRHAVRPETTGDRLRLQYLLYRDDVPAEPSAGTAYRSVHIWVNATGR